MLQKKISLLSALTALSISCLSALPVSADVLASVKPLGFIAAAIADGVSPVDVLLPDGASEHNYALRPSDVKRLQKADLVVWIGPDMEAFMVNASYKIPARHQLMLADSDEIKPLLIPGAEEPQLPNTDRLSPHLADTKQKQEHHHHGIYNMHIWMSPDIAWKSAVAIHGKLSELMPRSRDKLDVNLQQFEDSLKKSDRIIASRLAPVKSKGYFVFHDAYTYFERHYGLSQLGYFTVNPEIQPGAQRLHKIRTQLAEQKAVCIFAEPQFRPAVIDAVARGISVRKGTLDPLGMNISVGKDSYVKFLLQLSDQYTSCLKGA